MKRREQRLATESSLKRPATCSQQWASSQRSQQQPAAASASNTGSHWHCRPAAATTAAQQQPSSSPAAAQQRWQQQQQQANLARIATAATADCCGQHKHGSQHPSRHACNCIVQSYFKIQYVAAGSNSSANGTCVPLERSPLERPARLHCQWYPHGCRAVQMPPLAEKAAILNTVPRRQPEPVTLSCRPRPGTQATDRILILRHWQPRQPLALTAIHTQ